MCLSTCREKEFLFAGLELRTDCYCGNEPEQGFEWALLDKCDQRCAGNLKQICGGSEAMSLYSTSTIKNRQCVYEFPSSKRVQSDSSVTGRSNMNSHKCKKICKGRSLSRFYQFLIYFFHLIFHIRFRILWRSKWK